MSRYIDADAFLKALNEIQKPHDIGFGETTYLVAINLDSLINLIKDLPTEDVREVVLCKDCIYWQDNNDGYPHEECRWGHDETPNEDDYCSYGERREDGKIH